MPCPYPRCWLSRRARSSVSGPPNLAGSRSAAASTTRTGSHVAISWPPLTNGPAHPAARPAPVPDHHPRPVPEVVLVLGRHAQQIADRIDRERKRELVDQVRLALRGEAVDEVVGQLLHTRGELRDTPGRERF